MGLQIQPVPLLPGFLPPPLQWYHPAQRLDHPCCHASPFSVQTRHLTFLVGEAPSAISGYALPDDGKYQEDNVHLVLSFTDGSLGTIDYLANGDKSLSKERLEVFTGGQVAILDDFRTLELIDNGRRQVQRSRLRQDKGHLAEWQAFEQAILNRGAPPIPYEQLYGVSLASISAVEALRNGKTIPLSTRREP